MRTVKRSAQTAETHRRNGAIFEDLAALALDCAGFKGICNLNETVRRHFPYADLLAEENGIWYAISVKGRHKIMLTGNINNRYKLDMGKAHVALAELRSMGYECVPAWVAIEIDNDRYNAYFGRMHDSARTNGIGMNECEKARYRRLIANAPARAERAAECLRSATSVMREAGRRSEHPTDHFSLKSILIVAAAVTGSLPQVAGKNRHF